MRPGAPFAVTTLVLLSTTATFAQTTNRNGASQPPRAARTGDPDREHPKTEPAQAANAEAAQRTSAALRDHGGSLLRASIAARADRGQAKLSDVSYFAVAPPEPRAIRKHDLVTIIVREESQFNSKGTNDFKKEADLEAAIDEFIQLKLRNWEIQGGAIGPKAPSIKMTGKREFKGEGTVDRSDRILTRLTAEVLDVKPNGTMVLQARGRTKHDEEEQEFVLSGICRADDITADNTVLSSQLFDLSLEKRTKGDVRSATKRGWGGKLLDAISPF